MIFQMIEALGSWGWIVFGLILLALEVALPSVFFLWFGVSALIVGVITVALGLGNAFWPWQAQWIVFAVLSLITLIAGRRYMGKRTSDDAAKMLNQRGEQWVGNVATLIDTVENGRSRIRLGDSTWNVKMLPDQKPLKKGDRVKIVSADASLLLVEAL